MDNDFTIEITDELNGFRLDKALATVLTEYSRGRLQDVIADSGVTVNGSVEISPKAKVKAGDVCIVNIPEAVEADPEPQDIPLNIVYEDEDLLVINKQVGIVVHPAAGNYDGTLVNALLHHCGDTLSGIGGVKRPGIVHRLDKDTSGLMVVAKHDQAHQFLSDQLKDRSLSRVYHAFVWGVITPRAGEISTQIGRHPVDRKKKAVVLGGGRDAITDYKVLEQFGTLACLVECRLQTGRTHQIRVHMEHLKNYMIGDPYYGHPYLAKHLRTRIGLDAELAALYRQFKRQALHAAEMGFIHPRSKEMVHFKAEYPTDLKELHKALSKLNIASSR